MESVGSPGTTEGESTFILDRGHESLRRNRLDHQAILMSVALDIQVGEYESERAGVMERER